MSRTHDTDALAREAAGERPWRPIKMGTPTKFQYRGIVFKNFGPWYKGLPLKHKLQVIWGQDAWFGPIPFFKTMLAANVLVWVIGWLT